jgi:hypothetical protein
MAVAKKKPWAGSKEDEKADKKVMKGMTPAQKAKFEKADEKMDKNKKMSKSEDMKKDKALADKLKKKKSGK